MHPTIELMEEHVRDIYRALTGGELRDDELTEPTEDEVSVDEVTRRFMDLESSARRIPTIDERVPPFSFSPLLDAIEFDDDIVLELAVPGIEREDVEVACSGDFITIYGVRGGERGADSPHYLHAEIPRGPFYRVVRIPTAFVAEPRIEVERGVIRVSVTKARDAASQHVQNSASERSRDTNECDAPQMAVQQPGE
jgi:HSP20 family protein